MRDWLIFLTENSAIVINAMALLMIVFGTIEAFLRGLRAMVVYSATGKELRNGYQRYARWLIAGLTFQLAADIIETAITPGWDDIGRLAAIAVIRTFLNYFLERDLKDAVAFPTSQTEEAAEPKRPEPSARRVGG
jgi:uncharacterized membrane protein